MIRSYIVGVGASAGGLEAFTALLRHLPTDTGLSFVLVQHLDPKHESALTAILSKATAMPVREAADGVAVEPDHVYVIPPDAVLAIAGGVLKVSRPQVPAGARRNIDGFLGSLAQDQGERAIGVILSGTASDGTVGLGAIKAEGGITFAQDESAKYDSMPRNAVSAGHVDFVLSPKDIAQELALIARHSRGDSRGGKAGPAGQARGRADSQRGGSASAGVYGKILALLRGHSGADFSLYKPPTLQRRINRRMLLLKMRTLDAYLERLKADPAERDALYQDMLISVTGFFRDPEAFKALGQAAFPQMLKGRAVHDPVRVWVPGCSTGQEAYSIAMALVEAMGDEPTVRIQIYATDLNESLLEKARAGLYVKNLVHDVSPERLRRFFVEEEGAYRVAKPLREMCVFARHDLIADPPFSRMDLISCRNVLIYIDPETQKAVIPSFHYALKPKGILFLGASETISGFAGLFTSVDRKHRIYSKVPGPSRALTRAFPAVRQRDGRPAGGQPKPLRELDAQREADRVSLNSYVPPSVLVTDDLEILQFRGDTAPFLRPPRGKASFNLLKMAREGVLLPLRAAINRARKENQRVRKENVRIDQNGRSRRVHIAVQPLRNLKERCFLVFFEPAARHPAEPSSPAGREAAGSRGLSPKGEARETARLREELAETRDYLQSLQEQYEAAHEELQASSEEVQSSNEELQSINEELETSKEELESSNEELTTVNDEMANRNAELTRLTSDLNNLHASVDMAILLLGRDLRIRRFTPPAEKLFNLMASDVGRPLGAVKFDFEFPGLEEMVSDVIDDMSMRWREVQDRAGRWYSLRVRPYVTVDSKIDGAVLTVVDITDLKMALRKAEALVETAPPMLILDKELVVRKANRSFCEAFQVGMAETEGRFVYDLGNGQWNIPKLRTLLQEILPREKAVAHFEVDHEFQAIGPRTMLLSARELDWGAAGRTIMLSLLDITERKKALQEIERHNSELEQKVRERTAELTATNQELEAFAYSVAHDLRNPLRGIEGFSRILAKEYAGSLDERGRSYFERIRLAIHRMSHLIDSLLELARLTRAEIRREEVDLSRQVRSISEEFKKKQPEREVELVVEPGVKVVGDDRLLRIALTNLLENAWKFTGRHPRARIEFGLTRKDGEPVCFLRDDGAGFDMAFAEKLFQPFQRLHSDEEFPGTGIGLALVERIVRRHGGRIWAVGAVERGTTFYFSLSRPDAPGSKDLREVRG